MQANNNYCPREGTKIYTIVNWLGDRSNRPHAASTIGEALSLTVPTVHQLLRRAVSAGIVMRKGKNYQGMAAAYTHPQDGKSPQQQASAAPKRIVEPPLQADPFAPVRSVREVLANAQATQDVISGLINISSASSAAASAIEDLRAINTTIGDLVAIIRRGHATPATPVYTRTRKVIAP